jgi:hypothetical protein
MRSGPRRVFGRSVSTLYAGNRQSLRHNFVRLPVYQSNRHKTNSCTITNKLTRSHLESCILVSIVESQQRPEVELNVLRRAMSSLFGKSRERDIIANSVYIYRSAPWLSSRLSFIFACAQSCFPLPYKVRNAVLSGA